MTETNSPREIALVKEVKLFVANIWLKITSLPTKFLMTKASAAAEKTIASKCETQKKYLNFLPKKTSSIRIIKAPEKSAISGKIGMRFRGILIRD